MATRHPGGAADASAGDDLRDRSLGELLKQFSEQTTRLVHQELELAKAELQQKGRQAGAGAGRFGGAGALGLAALTASTPRSRRSWLCAAATRSSRPPHRSLSRPSRR